MATRSELAGNEVVSYIQANGGDCSQNLASLVHLFQVAYNLEVDQRVYNGPKLVEDGKYGNDTASAFTEVFLGKSTPTPKPLYGSGNPCFGCGILPGGQAIRTGIDIIPAQPLGYCPAFPRANGGVVTPPGGNFLPLPSPPTNPPTLPGNTTTTTTNTTAFNAAPWVTVGVALLAGLGVYYGIKAYQTKQERDTIPTGPRSSRFSGRATRTTPARSIRYV